MVLQALKYLEWDGNNIRGPYSGLLRHDRISEEKFEHVMKSYYETPQSPGGDFFPPVGAIEEFTNLYQASRHILNETRQAKGFALNRGDVCALPGSIMRDLKTFNHRRINAMTILQRLQVKFVLQRTFRAHALLDPAVAADDDDEDLISPKPSFAERLRRGLASIYEALPNVTISPRLLLLPTVLALAILVYATIWRFSSTLTWDSAAVSRVFNTTKLTGYLPSTNSSSDFLPLYQQLEIYKLDVNATEDIYQECDLKITQAVDLVLRRTEKLATNLKMIEMTIKLSKSPFLKPFFKLFHFASKEALRTQAFNLYESYSSDLKDEKYIAYSKFLNLKQILGDLKDGWWQLKQISKGNVPFDLNRFITENVVRPIASFNGKKQRAVIRPDVLEQFRIYNNQVEAFTEDYVRTLFNELRDLSSVVVAQHIDNEPLKVQVDNIVRANVKLRKVKKSALVIKNRLESNGTIKAAGAAILDLPS